MMNFKSMALPWAFYYPASTTLPIMMEFWRFHMGTGIWPLPSWERSTCLDWSASRVRGNHMHSHAGAWERVNTSAMWWEALMLTLHGILNYRLPCR